MKKIYGTINTLTGLLIILLMVLSFAVQMKYNGSPYTDAVAYQDGWTYDTSDTANIQEIDAAKKYIQRYISSDELNGQSLCFMSRNANFSVYLDDDEIYDFNPKGNNNKRGLYGDYLHTIPIPHFDGCRHLKIEFHDLDINISAGFYEMVLQNSGSYLLSIAQRDKLKFLVCLMTFLIGIIVFSYGILEQTFHGDMIETVCLGTFTMLIGVWTSPKLSVLFMLAGNSVVMRAVEYISLAIIPIPVVTFAASVTKKFRNPLFIFCLSSATINLLSQFIIAGADILDYKEMLRFSHIIILICLICIVIMFSSAYYKKEIDIKSTTYLTASVALILVSGMVDMLRYYVHYSMDSAKVTRLAMPVFVIALIIYEVRKMITFQIKSSEAELMEKLAMEDALTGIKNRNAFTSWEKKLLEQDTGTYVFVHFDVNRLKKVNDTYGHAEGDRHIKAAANVIRESFGNAGECFRIGGDEFFVILGGRKCRANYDTGLKKFIKLQEEYNSAEKPPVALEMAYGMAEYDCSMKNPEAAESLADSRMYEKKKLMKANSLKKNMNGNFSDIKPPEFIHNIKKAE